MRLIRRMRPLRAFALLPLLLLALTACDSESDSESDPDLGWASIPAGSFTMGCKYDNSDDYNYWNCPSPSSPSHEVNVPAFEMMATEVTQTQYEQVIGSNPLADTMHECADCPVARVSWHDTRAFCEAVGGRLPSEAEWEYAARAGTEGLYYCGEEVCGIDVEIEDCCLLDIAWVEQNSDNHAHPVGEKQPNAFGLYDMHGNVTEWVEDCWHPSFEGAPDDGSAWVMDCVMYPQSEVVTRNQSYQASASSSNSLYDRGPALMLDVAISLGFRCARDGE